jgi:hypothetical protein
VNAKARPPSAGEREADLDGHQPLRIGFVRSAHPSAARWGIDRASWAAGAAPKIRLQSRPRPAANLTLSVDAGHDLQRHLSIIGPRIASPDRDRDAQRGSWGGESSTFPAAG